MNTANREGEKTGYREPETGSAAGTHAAAFGDRASKALGRSAARRVVSRLRLLPLLTLVVLFGAVACTRAPSPETTSEFLRLSQRNEPADLDPATATLPDEFAILRALSEGLLLPGPNGTAPLPGAAERFDVSPDGLTYTFHLRRGARWSNGEPVTAHDFVASYRRLLTPATAAPKANVFYPVRQARAFVAGEITDFSQVGIRAADAHTLVITLAQPSPRFPHYVASGPWLPVHLATVQRHGRKWTLPENFVGNGPFLLAEWRPQQRIVVRRNPDWHGAARVRLAGIEFIRFDSGDAEERAYRTGQIHVTMAVPESKVAVYAAERPAEIHRAPMIETRYLSFNTHRPPLHDARVRRALALAIHRDRIAERVTRGGQLPATRFLPPPLQAPPNSRAAATTGSVVDGGLDYDPSTARALLAEAGLSPANFPRLELSAWSNTPVLEAVQAMWRQELGIEVAIAVREARVHLSALASGDYDIGFITAIPDVADPANLLGDFISDAPENYPHWRDPAFDRAFATALATPAEPARTLALAAAEDRLLAAAAVAPLYFNAKVWLMSPRVQGWQEDALWSRTYRQVHLAPK